MISYVTSLHEADTFVNSSSLRVLPSSPRFPPEELPLPPLPEVPPPPLVPLSPLLRRRRRRLRKVSDLVLSTNLLLAKDCFDHSRRV
jgi:hypothetical protein